MLRQYQPAMLQPSWPHAIAAVAVLLNFGLIAVGAVLMALGY